MRKDLLISLFFAILWTCKPISYQDLIKNQSIREKTIVLTKKSQLRAYFGSMIRLDFKISPKSTIACIEKNSIFLLSGAEIQMSSERRLGDS